MWFYGTMKHVNISVTSDIASLGLDKFCHCWKIERCLKPLSQTFWVNPAVRWWSHHQRCWSQNWHQVARHNEFLGVLSSWEPTRHGEGEILRSFLGFPGELMVRELGSWFLGSFLGGIEWWIEKWQFDGGIDRDSTYGIDRVIVWSWVVIGNSSFLYEI